MSEPFATALASRAVSSSPLTRVALVGLVSLALVVPLAMVRGLVSERRHRGAQAAAEIAEAWSGRQTLAPPALRLVYLCLAKNERGEVERRRKALVVLPEELEVTGSLAPEQRARGLFSTVVYRADLHTKGELRVPTLDSAGFDCAGAELESASLAVGFSDNRSIDRLGALSWPGAAPEWTPGTPLCGPWTKGVSAPLATGPLVAGARLPFAFDLELRGSQSLEVLPVGRETRVELRSSYPSPSFQGAFLPTRRALDASGFSAVWKISPFSRSFAQSFAGDSPPDAIATSPLGVALALPVDGYLMTERALKYAILVVGLTFLACLLLEIADASPARASLHPMHYLLVGAALAIFYLLLLALSEQLAFGGAYALASGAITLLLAGYVRAILRSTARALVLAAAIGSCYAGLYVLLGKEELALLAGSIGTFVALAMTMWLTRRIDWSTAFARPRTA